MCAVDNLRTRTYDLCCWWNRWQTDAAYTNFAWNSVHTSRADNFLHTCTSKQPAHYVMLTLQRAQLSHLICRNCANLQNYTRRRQYHMQSTLIHCNWWNETCCEWKMHRLYWCFSWVGLCDWWIRCMVAGGWQRYVWWVYDDGYDDWWWAFTYGRRAQHTRVKENRIRNRAHAHTPLTTESASTMQALTSHHSIYHCFIPQLHHLQLRLATCSVRVLYVYVRHEWQARRVWCA